MEDNETLYMNREFRIVAKHEDSGPWPSSLMLMYDVDLHCATILMYFPGRDSYSATDGQAFARAWAILNSAYLRERIPDLGIFDLKAGARFFRGLRDYFVARRRLTSVADKIYKEKLMFSRQDY